MFRYLFLLFIACSVFFQWQTVTTTDINGSFAAEVEISSEIEQSSFEFEQNINKVFHFPSKIDSFQFSYLYLFIPKRINSTGSFNPRAPPQKVS